MLFVCLTNKITQDSPKGLHNGCLSQFLYLFKCSNIQIFGCSKPPPNPFQISKSENILSKFGKSRHVGTGCFLSKFRLYSDVRQTSKNSNILHIFSYIRRPIPKIHLLTSYFPGCLQERVSQKMQITPYL